MMPMNSGEDTIETFDGEVKQVLEKIGFENKLCFLLGDFNIDILSADSHNPTSEFIDLMNSNDFYPLSLNLPGSLLILPI